MSLTITPLEDTREKKVYFYFKPQNMKNTVERYDALETSWHLTAVLTCSNQDFDRGTQNFSPHITGLDLTQSAATPDELKTWVGLV